MEQTIENEQFFHKIRDEPVNLDGLIRINPAEYLLYMKVIRPLSPRIFDMITDKVLDPNPIYLNTYLIRNDLI